MITTQRSAHYISLSSLQLFPYPPRTCDKLHVSRRSIFTEKREVTWQSRAARATTILRQKPPLSFQQTARRKIQLRHIPMVTPAQVDRHNPRLQAQSIAYN